MTHNLETEFHFEAEVREWPAIPCHKAPQKPTSAHHTCELLSHIYGIHKYNTFSLKKHFPGMGCHNPTTMHFVQGLLGLKIKHVKFHRIKRGSMDFFMWCLNLKIFATHYIKHQSTLGRGAYSRGYITIGKTLAPNWPNPATATCKRQATISGGIPEVCGITPEFLSQTLKFRLLHFGKSTVEWVKTERWWCAGPRGSRADWGANSSLQLPCRGKHADLRRVVFNVTWSFRGSEGS